MSSSKKQSSESPTEQEKATRSLSVSKQRIIGLSTGIAAAIGYTFASMALRQIAKPDNFDWAIWVTSQKAIPAMIMTWILVAINFRKGKTALPPRKLILPLILTGLTMQLFGNLMFQYALSLIGLAMTVPIMFALLLVSGAVCSRIYLGEPITIRTLLALVTLMIAVTVLSLGAGKASEAILEKPSSSQFLLGIFIALLSGIGYGVCGVMIRKNVRQLPVSATLVLISSTGVVFMGGLSLCRIPIRELLATTPTEYGMVFLAGVFNAAAFYSIGTSYRYLNVTQVNMVNASQIAMAMLAGVLFFMEPVTVWLVIGVFLTVLGLFMMDKQ